MNVPARLRASIVAAVVAAVSATADAQRIEMPVGSRLTWIGARWNVGARVVDPSGRALPTPLVYRISDPEIAAVSGRGEVVARKPGRTRVWAVAGRDSASALVIVEQWPARFSFSPSVLRLDALTARQPLRVVASDSGGVPIVGGPSRVSACRALDERIATVTGGEVVAVGNGATWIRCSDRGIADSVRVDVQQRAVRAEISNRAVLNRRLTVGDTFSIRVLARDRMQKDLVNPRPTWASLSPSIVSVNPSTGRARAVTGGVAKLIVQIGDAADSTTVSVEGSSLFAAPAPVVAVADSTPKSRASIVGQETFAFENETTYVTVSVTDSTGQPASVSSLRMRVLDTTIAVLVDAEPGKIFGKRSGVTQVVATYGRLIDTLGISVRPRPVGGPSVRSDSGPGASTFVPPPTFLDSIPVYQQRRRQATTSITTNPQLATARQNLIIVPVIIGAIAEHYSKTDAGITEDRTGALYGGGGTLLLYQRLEVSGALRMGTLSSVDPIGESLTMTEFDGSVGLFPIQSLGLRGGIVMRGERSALASQNWIIPKVSLVTRFGFIGDIVSTHAAFSVLPKASFSGLPGERGTLFSRGGEAGLDFRLNRLNAGVSYFVERLSFDESLREESFSALRLRFGFNLGR